MNDYSAWLAKIERFIWAGNDLIVSFNHYLAAQFGRTFQLAVDWVLLGLLLILALRIFKFSFDVLRFVLVPSVVVSGLVAVTTSLPFLYVMPLVMGAGTVFMLFKS